jgi:hypothetical protein
MPHRVDAVRAPASGARPALARPLGAVGAPSAVLALQRAHGNQAVRRLLAPGPAAVVQRDRDAAVAKANELRPGRAKAYASWDDVSADMTRVGARAKPSDFTEEQAALLNAAFYAPPRTLPDEWLTVQLPGRSLVLTMPADAAVERDPAGGLLSADVLGTLTNGQLVRLPEKVQAIVAAKPWGEESSAGRWVEHRFASRAAKLKTHLTALATQRQQLGGWFDKAVAKDAGARAADARPADRARRPEVEPGTYAKVAGKGPLAIFEEWSAESRQLRRESSYEQGEITGLRMYRFTGHAPEALRSGYVMVSFYLRGKKLDKAKDWAKVLQHEEGSVRIDGYARADALTPYFATPNLTQKSTWQWEVSDKVRALPLFKPGGGPTKADIMQGITGQCWLLAALISIVDRDPKLVEDMIHDNGDSVTVRFYRDGQPEFVTVTKEILKAKWWGVGYHLSSRGGKANATWPILLLKAYAAWPGNSRERATQDLDLGNSNVAFQDFLGIGASEDVAAGSGKPTVETRIQDALRAGKFVAAGSRAGLKNAILFSAIQQQHAYAVLGADASGVMVRNPWGKKKMLSVTANAEFRVSWTDFKTSFDKVYFGERAARAQAEAPAPEPAAAR